MTLSQQLRIVCPAVYDTVYIDRLADYFVDSDIIAADQLSILMLR